MEIMLVSWSHVTNFCLWCGLLYTTGNLEGIFCNILNFEIYAGSLAHHNMSDDSRLSLSLSLSLTPSHAQHNHIFRAV
jgi:hypothetical protein